MARISALHTGFNAGEWSAFMYGRTDLPQYANALKTCINGVPLVQGPWTRRPGTVFLHQVKNHDEQQVLVRFRHNSGNNYILEFGVGYIRVYVDQGITVNTGQAIEGITNANPAAVTASSHGYVDGDRLEFYDVVGMHQVNGREVQVTSASANNFVLSDSDGNLLDSTNWGAFTSGNMASIYEIETPYTANQLFDLHFCQNEDTLFIFHESVKTRILTRASATSWTLAEFTTRESDGPYYAANTTSTTLTPDQTTNTNTTSITGMADNGAGLIQVTATAHGLATDDAVLIQDVLGTTESNGYWLVTQISPNVVDLQASTFSNAWSSGGTVERLISVTASATDGINDGLGFVSTDVGRAVRMLHNSTVWGSGVIGYVAETGLVWVDDSVEAFGNTTATTTWRLGAWSDTTGYPRTGAFHEDRLWAAGPTDQPQLVVGSKTSDYANFAPTDRETGVIADDNAIDYPLNADDLHECRWLASTNRGLAVGTTRGEWLIKAGSTTAEVITPDNVTGKPSSYHGANDNQPIRIGSSVLFVQRGDRKLREYAYLFEQDDYDAVDLTIPADHITAGGIVQSGVMRLPQTIVWSVRNDGTLLGMTYDKSQGVQGWHRHTIGGYADVSASSTATVSSIALVPSADGALDELYMITSRYIDGGVKKYIEYMAPFWEPNVDVQADAIFLDAAWVQVSTAATTTVSQLHHLEGQSVIIYGDGALYPAQTVTNGVVTTSLSCFTHCVGFEYNSDFEPLSLEAGAADGSPVSKQRRINRVGIRLADALDISWGPDADNLVPVLTAEWGNFNYGEAKPLYTGILRAPLPNAGPKRDGNVYIRASGPFPATVLSLAPQADVQDDT